MHVMAAAENTVALDEIHSAAMAPVGPFCFACGAPIRARVFLLLPVLRLAGGGFRHRAGGQAAAAQHRL